MLVLGKGSIARQLLHAVISIALRLFFRRIETSGVERVPTDSPVIFVLNHPNGLVDPALVFVSLPRRVSFLAKSTLFTIPIAGALIRALEALPVYRRVDADGDPERNAETFNACRRFLAENRCVAIFPEGLSHDDTKLKPVKTGAARIALGALGIKREGSEKLDLKIAAVGLFYTSKTAFRSEVLIRYGEILDVEPVALDADLEPPADAVRGLTERIETALRAATLNLESQDELDAVLKAEALFSSVYRNLLFKNTLNDSFRRLQNLAERYELLGRNDPERKAALGKRIEKYEAELSASGVTSESLSVLQHPTLYVFRFLFLRLFVILLLSPLAILGAVIHSPAYVFSNFVGLMFRTHGPDSAGSTFKILAAIVLMPLTWLIVAGVAWYFFGWQIAAASVPLTALCGYIALRSSETLIDLKVWLKSVWLLLRQRALFLRLLLEREDLNREIGDLIDNGK
ncbi:MAG: 1-acyl-sn-glycerol-3-phosphate acyltransferase [Acidobacteria bacterium]|nr:1-acyl-sn-glycerol-3-phosphate acyltransferase [Acidobacteriota bacterium]